MQIGRVFFCAISYPAYRALQEKIWPLRCSENCQDNDGETGILKYVDAAGNSHGNLQ